jgi:hypothetical protein
VPAGTATRPPAVGCSAAGDVVGGEEVVAVEAVGVAVADGAELDSTETTKASRANIATI